MISLRLAGHRVSMGCGQFDANPNTGLITRVEGEWFWFIDDMEPELGEYRLTRSIWQVVEVNNVHQPNSTTE